MRKKPAPMPWPACRPCITKHIPATIKAYYQAILDAVSLPVFGYNFPAAVGYGLSPDLVGELAEMGLTGLKDSGNDLAWFYPGHVRVSNPDFTWFMGNTAPDVPGPS